MHLDAVLVHVWSVHDVDTHRGKAGAIDRNVAERRSERVGAADRQALEPRTVRGSQQDDLLITLPMRFEAGIRDRRNRAGVHIAGVRNDQSLWRLAFFLRCSIQELRNGRRQLSCVSGIKGTSNGGMADYGHWSRIGGHGVHFRQLFVAGYK